MDKMFVDTSDFEYLFKYKVMMKWFVPKLYKLKTNKFVPALTFEF